jgi:hypothetical protein
MPKFDARAVTEEKVKGLEPFEFVGLDGGTYTLPHPGTMTEEQGDRLQSDPKALIAELDPQAFEAIQQMQLPVSSALIQAWLDELGEAGKSPSPSRAIRRAAQRSKRTSPSAASA